MSEILSSLISKLSNYGIELNKPDCMSDESHIIGLVNRSNYLFLLKTEGVYHLRHKFPTVSGDEYLQERDISVHLDKLISSYLLISYKIKFDEDFSQYKSGDINRSVISSGKLIKSLR